MHEFPDVEVRVAVLVTTDSRDDRSDETGKILVEELRRSGFEVVGKRFCPNSKDKIAEEVKELAEAADVVIVSGGTGVSRKDVSVDAIKPLLEKELPGFGEVFRARSYEKIGHFALSSRACAGVFRGTVVFCIPGSKSAARDALEIIVPALKHLVYEVKYK